jgi:hypothetical protein
MASSPTPPLRKGQKMKKINIHDDLAVCGTCDDPCCANDVAGTTIQIQAYDEAVNIPLLEVPLLIAALQELIA